MPRWILTYCEVPRERIRTFGLKLEAVPRKRKPELEYFRMNSKLTDFQFYYTRNGLKTNEIIMDTLQIKNDLPKFNSSSSTLKLH